MKRDPVDPYDLWDAGVLFDDPGGTVVVPTYHQARESGTEHRDRPQADPVFRSDLPEQIVGHLELAVVRIFLVSDFFRPGDAVIEHDQRRVTFPDLVCGGAGQFVGLLLTNGD